jgi:hypothetical protein
LVIGHWSFNVVYLRQNENCASPQPSPKERELKRAKLKSSPLERI